MKCPKCGFNNFHGNIRIIFTGNNYFITCNQCDFTEWIGDIENGKSTNYYRWDEYCRFDSKFNHSRIVSPTVEKSLLLD